MSLDEQHGIKPDSLAWFRDEHVVVRPLSLLAEQMIVILVQGVAPVPLRQSAQDIDSTKFAVAGDLDAGAFRQQAFDIA